MKHTFPELIAAAAVWPMNSMFYGQSWKDVPIEEFIIILDEYIH